MQQSERVTLQFPAGLDPNRVKAKLVKMLAEQHGEGFEIDSIDAHAGIAYASRQSELTQISDAADDAELKYVKLGKGVKAGDGDRQAARLAEQYAHLANDRGAFEMTRFTPFLGTAELTRLDPETSRARAAVAVALGVKPWDVTVTPRARGGFDIKLPNSYVQSKHDDKLTEVAESVVGRPGWYVESSPKRLTASIIPGEPPTFPPSMPYPLAKLGKGDPSKLLIGRALSERADVDGDDVYINFDSAPHTQISGTSGSGKTVLLHSMIAGALASGSELAIVDLAFKAVDFTAFRKFVRPGGWGCAEATTVTANWLPEALTTLALVYEEGMRRAGLLADHNVTKVGDLPRSAEVKPIFVIVDEVTGILQLDEVPKGVPKDHPMVVEANHSNLMRQMILGYLRKIAAELRFAGIRLVLSSQVSSVNTGVPTSLRMNLANKALQGPNPTEGNRKLSLTDASSVPLVPENVRNDGRVSKGVGVAELDGQIPTVYKSFYASPDELVAALDRLGVPTTDQPRPTAAQIQKHTPALGEDDGGGRPARSGTADDDYGYAQRSDGEFLRDFDQKREGGFAGANEARRQLDAAAGTARRKPVEMAQAGPVTVRRVGDPVPAAAPFDEPTITMPRKSAINPSGAPMCPTCDRPMDPISGACACSR